MVNVVRRYVDYLKERRHIRSTLRLDNDNFW